MSILNIFARAKEEKTTELNLSNQNLRILPPELFELEFLEKLNLDGNMLVDIPEDIGKLKN